MNKQEQATTINAFNRMVDEVVEGEAIPHLSNKGTYNQKGKQLLYWQSNLAGALSQNGLGVFNNSDNIDDLDSLSDSLQNIIGQMYIYREFINDPTHAPVRGGNKIFYSKRYNVAEREFDILTSYAYQTWYNYWDRIGDMIECFFPLGIGATCIGFDSVMKKLPLVISSTLKNRGSYLWLDSFYKTDFLTLNKLRIDVVHYVDTTTSTRKEHMANITDYNILKQKFKDKKGRADDLKHQAQLMIDGCFHSLQLLDDMFAEKGITINSTPLNAPPVTP